MRVAMMGMAIALMVLNKSAIAVDDMIEQAIRDAVSFRQKVEVGNNLRRITAYYLGESAGCSNISIETNERLGRTSYRVCGNVIQERSEVEPAAPNSDPAYRRVVVMTGRQALLSGAAVGRFEGYLVQARRVGWPDGNGCGIVEVNVNFDGLLVDTAQSRVCP
jgi:hypothetical protein